MEIRKGTPADLEAIMQVVATARQYMRDSGNLKQWIKGYPSRELFLSDMGKGNCYVGTENGKVHGVFAMLMGPDPTYNEIDGAWLNDKPYAVIHRIGSDGQIHGFMRAAVAYTQAHVCEEIRADTHADNKNMQRTLTNNGFVYCGEIIIEDGTPRSAYHLTAKQ